MWVQIPPKAPNNEETMGKIVGLVGLAGSGKNSVANILMKHYPNWISLSSGSAVKDIIANIFGWSRKLLEGDTEESRAWREKADEYWSKKLGREWTPRIAMQWFATDIIRDQLSESFWIDKTEQNIHKILESNPSANIAITDVRFKNEIDLIRRLGGQIWEVSVGEYPDWYYLARDYNKELIEYPTVLDNIHRSEWDWIGYRGVDLYIHAPYKSLELLEDIVLDLL